MKTNKPSSKEDRVHEVKSTDTIQQQKGRNTGNIFGLENDTHNKTKALLSRMPTNANNLYFIKKLIVTILVVKCLIQTF